MSEYPDWVKAYRRKGTSIKRVGNEYYLYKTTSKRVEGKKNPQPISEYIGKIERNGVVESKIKKLSTESLRVYEYGLSYALKVLLSDKFLINSHDEETLWYAFLHIVKSQSPNSYLLRNVNLPTEKELRISLNNQMKRYERLSGITIAELKPLANLYLIETKECDLLSEISDEMQEVLDRIGVEINVV
jgi:hypothetical protein